MTHVASQPDISGSRSEQDLVRRAQAGSLAAFARLVTMHQARVYNFLLRRLGRTDDAEDVTQETFIRAWERIHRYDPSYRFTTWLLTIAARLGATHLRQRSTRERHETARERESGRMFHCDADRLEASEDRHAIWEVAAEKLTSKQHAVLWLKYGEDLSNREIARIIGGTQIAVRVTLHRAKQTLSTCLAALDRPRQPVGRPRSAAMNGRTTASCESTGGL
jgi:RNA polymerase sigma-70 factor (ECF subfamily)